MSELQIRIKENAIITALIKLLDSVYIRLIAAGLIILTTRKITQFFTEQLPSAVAEMKLTLEEYFVNIFRLEFSRDRELSIEELRTLITRFGYDVTFSEALKDFEERMKTKILEISVLDIDNQQFQRMANEIGISELASMKRIAVTEGHRAINQARALFFEQEDPMNENRYKWQTVKDSRVSLQCRTIEARVNQAGGSMQLDDLRKLVDQVAVEINPKWVTRDWNPHINCRSYLVKI